MKQRTAVRSLAAFVATLKETNVNIAPMLGIGHLFARRCALAWTILLSVALGACSGGGGGSGSSATYTISGAVIGASDVAVALSGAATGSLTTDANGNYRFTSLGNGSYTLTPSKSGYTFTPTSARVTVNGASVTSGTAFAATANATYTLSGTITGAVTSGVTVALSGAASASTVSIAGGGYSFQNLPPGTYTVTPALSGYSFSPYSKGVTITAADSAGNDFTASVYTVTDVSISGAVSGAVKAGITIVLYASGGLGGPEIPAQVTTTDANGSYTFPVKRYSGTYSIRPSLAGYSFSPYYLDVRVSFHSITGQNFLSTAVVAAAHALSGTIAAQAATARQSGAESRYILKDLGTFGGPSSNSNGGSVILNSQGTVVGGADTAEWDPICACHAVHAFRGREGPLEDLGTLPGGNNFSFAVAINSSGVIAGVSDNGVFDPASGETFVATVWQPSGEIANLGTFGGLWSLPFSINDRGQLVGGAENTTPDPDNLSVALTGNLPAPTLWHAALWQNGTIEDLGTLGGPASFAYYINERGQVAGVSYTSPTSTEIHPFFWENGHITDIGTLGGKWARLGGMNSRGQVVGSSELRSGYQHAFRWFQGRLTDLGTLGGTYSFATAINDDGWIVGGASLAGDYFIGGFLWRGGVTTNLGQLFEGSVCNIPSSINATGQIVGESDTDCYGTGGRAWIWENGGPMIDLNSLVPPGSDLYLVEAQFINDRGEIAGFGVLPNGDGHAFLLIPRKTEQ